MDEPYIGSIILFAGNFVPRGWAICDGSMLSIAQHAALFSILGTTYGGNGTTNFALPDLRGRVPVGPGSGPGRSAYSLGEIGGAESASLSIANLPPHNHAINADNKNNGREYPGPNHVLGTSMTDKMYSAGEPDTQLSIASVGMTGSGQPVSVVQPYQCINYIIAIEGLYPVRD